MLHNYRATKLAAWNAHTHTCAHLLYDSFVESKSGLGSTGSSASESYLTIINMSLEAVVSFQSSTAKGSASDLTQLLAEFSPLQTRRLKASVSCLLLVWGFHQFHGPLNRATHKIVVCFIKTRKGGNLPERWVTILCNAFFVSGIL